MFLTVELCRALYRGSYSIVPHAGLKQCCDVDLEFVAAICHMSALTHSSKSIYVIDYAVDLRSPGGKGGGCCA